AGARVLSGSAHDGIDAVATEKERGQRLADDRLCDLFSNAGWMEKVDTGVAGWTRIGASAGAGARFSGGGDLGAAGKGFAAKIGRDSLHARNHGSFAVAASGAGGNTGLGLGPFGGGGTGAEFAGTARSSGEEQPFPVDADGDGRMSSAGIPA